MTLYRCLVMTAEGRSDWRSVEAAEVRGAVARLLSEGLTPLDIRTGKVGFAEILHRPIGSGRLGLSEQALMLTQLATLVRAGLPVDRSLDLIRQQTVRARPQRLLEQLVARIREGSSLSAAVESVGGFPGYVVGVLRAAERGGHLDDALASIAARLNGSASARQQLVTALAYPVVVLAATLIALALVLTQVVPQFAPIFEGEEGRLPALTRFVLLLSRLSGDYALFLLAVSAAVIGILILAIRRPPGFVSRPDIRRRISALNLRDQYLAGQFIAILGTLVQNGVPVASALPLAATGLNSGTWRRSLQKVEMNVREGGRLSSALSAADLVPSAAVRLIEVGERSGKLADTCTHASQIILQAAKARLDRIISLANPVAIVMLGGIVGSLVAGVMLGIFALGDFAG